MTGPKEEEKPHGQLVTSKNTTRTQRISLRHILIRKVTVTFDSGPVLIATPFYDGVPRPRQALPHG